MMTTVQRPDSPLRANVADFAEVVFSSAVYWPPFAPLNCILFSMSFFSGQVQLFYDE